MLKGTLPACTRSKVAHPRPKFLAVSPSVPLKSHTYCKPARTAACPQQALVAKPAERVNPPRCARPHLSSHTGAAGGAAAAAGGRGCAHGAGGGEAARPVPRRHQAYGERRHQADLAAWMAAGKHQSPVDACCSWGVEMQMRAAVASAWGRACGLPARRRAWRLASPLWPTKCLLPWARPPGWAQRVFSVYILSSYNINFIYVKNKFYGPSPPACRSKST